ncbi:beta-ketoacyl-ACP synthase [Colwellia sp. RSH04]|uniref:beta-ketoacyl-ACP synthase n=1 Tax=Colwellia sp. RSH04 TaxID=2305464 RepID=UPI000E57ECFE|nr:beta-ketoacyl-ACP synthase [Colwellia sp. RSH04]RHW75802.1 beta-ketoacyl-ACP synthase [Colwellia sp. RSH04]
MQRVVVTGMSAITALGDNWKDFSDNLKKGKNAVQTYQPWNDYKELNTRLAAPVVNFEKPNHYNRKQCRSMGRVSLMATTSTEAALKQANLLNSELLTNGEMGIAYGSSTGSTAPFIDFANLLSNKSMTSITSTSYIKMMAHTTAVNVGVFFGIKGRVYTTSSACTSGSQALGYAYEAIKYGKQTAMVAGGAEELCVTIAAVFDTLFATSTKNTSPEKNPKPYDIDRDGLVIGEGACTFILESYDSAKARGATILAELVGYGTNSDGKHVTQPSADTMKIAMEMAIKDAGIDAENIGYVNGHGTATLKGDIAETQATERALGKQTPISSLKSYLGHTLGACGSIEAWASINMMNDNWFAPTLNLTEVDPACGKLDYIKSSGLFKHTDFIMSNNFAFGGINTSLIFKRLNN